MISSMFGTLLRIIYDLVKDYPISIILLTIVVKTLLAPLAVSQFRYTKNMSKVAPLMKEIQEKYKNDPQTMNEKTMELYKTHNVNPISGCLPMLIQLPIFISLFNTLRDPLKYVFSGDALMAAPALSQSFFWITDLTKPDFISNVLPLTGFVGGLPGVLPILSALTTYIQMATTDTGGQGAANQQMKMMTTMMPMVILVSGYTMPAGLMIYWTVSNIYQIAQQYIITKLVHKDDPKVEDAAPLHPEPKSKKARAAK